MNNKWINKCLQLADKASKKGDLPISAIIVKDNKIISKAFNNKNIKKDVMGHAEIICIKKACRKLNRWNLSDCDMIVSLKPCPMCDLIIKEARINKVYYLLDKLDYKKTYDKTEYIKIDALNNEDKVYKEKLSKFFENKR